MAKCECNCRCFDPKRFDIVDEIMFVERISKLVLLILVGFADCRHPKTAEDFLRSRTPPSKVFPFLFSTLLFCVRLSILGVSSFDKKITLSWFSHAEVLIMVFGDLVLRFF